MRRTAGIAAVGLAAAPFALALVVLAFPSCGGDESGADDGITLPERTDLPETSTRDAASSTDAPVSDAPAASCDLSKPFKTPVRLTELDEISPRSTPRLSADELTLYFTTRGVDASSGAELGVLTRASKSAPFGDQKILSQSGVFNDNDPSVAIDHLSLWFHSGRNGTADIFSSTRISTGMPFGPAAIITVVSTDTANENQPYFRAGGNELWFISDRPGGAGLYDIYMSTKSGNTFAAPTRVVELSSPSEDWQPQPSDDGRTIIFASDRAGGLGKLDLWMAKRASTTAFFNVPVPLTELNSASTEQAGWLSADGCRIWFSSGRGTNDATQSIYYAERPRM